MWLNSEHRWPDIVVIDEENKTNHSRSDKETKEAVDSDN